MNKEKHLNKIKKLLRKARNNSSSHEAAAALRMAQKMMQEHGLHDIDVELLGITQANSEKAPSDAQKIPSYVAMLMMAVSLAFGVRALAGWRKTPAGDHKRSIWFYGPNERPEIAAYAFDVLTRILIRDRKTFIAGLRKGIKSATKTARADGYCESWVEGVHANLDEFACTDKEEALITEYKHRHFDDVQTLCGREAKQVRGLNEARYAGFNDGRRVKLNHAVTGRNAAQIAGLQ
ncbi:MAG: DUF2786 domain-containing protein [Plesiomonas sp.]|uniref:DUF2786 domain-containing protein n=1 Tax=Plesiomonas sp. TaxID=2486279 RepID=UPI003F378DD7